MPLAGHPDALYRMRQMTKLRDGGDAALPTAHQVPIGELLQYLAVEANRGLSSTQVEERLSRVGRNALPEGLQRAPWLKFFDQFKSFLIIVLLFAAGLAAIIGNWKDAVVIVAVVFLNAAVGLFQEHRAEQSLAVLRGMLPVKARVRRNGTIAEISADGLVPGDLVLLEAGDQVPADGRFVQAANVGIDESSLTGESQPVQKDADAPVPFNLPKPFKEREPSFCR
jgi:Ca2+-transporting ATPase